MRTALLILVILLAGAGPSCGRNGDGGPSSLVLIVIDTLRADHLGCYGYPEASTPVLDALAARGTRFARAVTPVPVTLPAMSSLLTGRYPYRHRVRDNEQYVLPDDEVTLTERFRKAGWKTAAVVASGILAADRGLDQGFEVYDDRFGGEYPVYQPALAVFADEFAGSRRRADRVTDRALGLVDGFGKDRFFLLVHYFDVHSYYDPPPEYDRLHPSRPYDGEISFVDAEIGRLLAGLRDDAAVLVVSDHGEGLGDHGETEHGFLVYQSTLEVPVIAAGPGIPAGLVRNDRVSLVDLEPTLGAWFDLPGAGSPRDGRRLGWDAEAPPVPLYAETCRTLVSYSWSELRAVIDGDLKLIAGPTDELYDLASDPREMHELEDAGPAGRLAGILEEMTGGETRRDVLEALSGAEDPGRKELLESLGYISPDPGGTARDYPHPRDALPLWVERQRTKALYRKGVTLAVAGRYEIAVAVFDTVLTRDPRADVHYNRGLARRHLGDEAGFREDIRAALAIDADYIPALSMQAALDHEAGRDTEAVAAWKHIYELNPHHVPTLRALAAWHAGREEWEQALRYLRTQVNETPEDAGVRFNLGIAAARAGYANEARTHLEAFLRQAPTDPKAESVREILEQLGGS